MLTSPSAAIVVVCILLPLLDVLVVSLRLWAKRIKRQSLGIDDYVILIALMVLLASCWAYIWGAVKGGVGFHIKDVSMENLVFFQKVIFALQFPYLVSVTLIKLSILYFYQRIFAIPTFIKVAQCMRIFVILWFIAFFLATLFQSWPIWGNWTLGGKYDIMNQYAMYAAAAVLEIIADVVTLTMPMFVIWKLHIGSREKWVISMIFLLGGFVCFTSVVRLYYIVSITGPNSKKDIDLTYSIANIILWSAIEPYVGLICACLPTLRPIFRGRKMPPVLSSLRSLIFTRSTHTQRVETKNSDGNKSKFTIGSRGRTKPASANSLPSEGSVYRADDEEALFTHLTKDTSKDSVHLREYSTP